MFIVWRIIAVIASITFFTGGCDILSSQNCDYVDLGGGRRVTYTCYPYEAEGTMSAGGAAALLILGGFGLLILGFWSVIWAGIRNWNADRKGSNSWNNDYGSYSGSTYKSPYSSSSSSTSSSSNYRGSYSSYSSSAGPDMSKPDMSKNVPLSIAAVLKKVALKEGVGTAGWNHAVELMVMLGNGLISEYDANLMLSRSSYEDADLYGLPDDLKWVLVRATIGIAISDYEFTDAERDAIIEVIQDLWRISEAEATVRFFSIMSVLTDETDPKKAEALETLGLGHDASTTEIRAAYLRLVRENHPDAVPPDQRAAATTRTAEINAAYDYLMGQSP